MKVYELAKDFEIKALELIDKIKPLDLNVKNHMSDLSEEQVTQIRNFFLAKEEEAKPKRKKRATVRKRKAPAVAQKKAVIITRSRKTEGEEAEVEDSSQKATTVEATTVEASSEDKLESNTASSVAETPSVEASPEESPTGPTEELAKEKTVLETAASKTEEPAPNTEEVVAEKSKYSVIRVASRDSLKAQVRRPLIVQEADADTSTSSSPKTTSGSKRTVEAILKEIQREEIQKKKSTLAPKAGAGNQFKSTDYLRRERIYQVRKKRLNLQRSTTKVSTIEMGDKKKFVEFDEAMFVDDLASQLKTKSRDLLRKMRSVGLEMPEDIHSVNDWALDFETTQILASEFGYEVKDKTTYEDKLLEEQSATDNLEVVSRPPVITIMGHVDHGKTSILDLLRRARVVAGEAGGITQHIGAYQVDVSEAVENLKFSQLSKAEQKKAKKAAAKGGAKKQEKKEAKLLTFLDTPGHAAFTAMRSRGAKVTDMVVLVVSATEGVMPQTKEAIDHAKAAGVPIIVAVNKMDLPEANFEKSQQQLSEFEVVPEDWGGDSMFIPVSAHTGEGMDKLVEALQLQADVLELKAPINGNVEGSIVEAHLDKGKGPVATLLVQKGIIRVGDYIVAGVQCGRIRALIDDQGKNIESAGPSTPVAVLGLDGVPAAGDNVNVVDNERAAKELLTLRQDRIREADAKKGTKMTLEDLFAKMNEGEILELPIVLKSDVRGSAEAIETSLMKIPSDKVRLKVIRNAIGGISSDDVLLASASGAVVIGFNVRPDTNSKKEAENRGIQLKTYEVIYNLIDDVKKAMEGLLSPDIEEETLGKAEVRNVFNLTKSGTVAGSFVIEGKVVRGASVRLIRDGRVVYTGKMSGLKRFKDDAKEVAKGYECGISLENFNDVKNGDIIEAYQQKEVAATLEGPVPGATNTSSQQPDA